MNIYTPEGWLDVPKIVNIPVPFIFITGGRGIGKSYGAYGYTLNETPGRFIFWRRTRDEWETMCFEEFNPYKTYNNDHDTNYRIEKAKKVSGLAYIKDGDENTVGLFCPMLRMSKVRGFDSSDVDLIFYDEFIPEQHSRRVKGEEDAILNAYETVNRNRELAGRPPVKLLAASNSNALDNPLYRAFDLVDVAVKLQNEQREVWISRERGVCLINCENSPVSQAKNETALYNATKGTAFHDMAISNMFNDYDGGNRVHTRDLSGYTPICSIGEYLNVYRNRTDRKYYVSRHKSGTCRSYGKSDTEIQAARMKENYLVPAYYDMRLEFESYKLQTIFEKTFRLTT